MGQHPQPPSGLVTTEAVPIPGQTLAWNLLGNPFRGDRVPETGGQESHMRMLKNQEGSAWPPSTKQHGGHVCAPALLGRGRGGLIFTPFWGFPLPRGREKSKETDSVKPDGNDVRNPGLLHWNPTVSLTELKTEPCNR